MRAPVKLYLASSNPGKLAEFRALSQTLESPTPAQSVPSASDASSTDSTSAEIEFALVPGFSAMPEFEENAPTFAENALGKALHYSRLWMKTMVAEIPPTNLSSPTTAGWSCLRSAALPE